MQEIMESTKNSDGPTTPSHANKQETFMGGRCIECQASNDCIFILSLLEVILLIISCTSIIIHQFVQRTIEATILIMYFEHKAGKIHKEKTRTKDRSFLHEENINGEKHIATVNLELLLTPQRNARQAVPGPSSKVYLHCPSRLIQGSLSKDLVTGQITIELQGT